MASMIGLDLRGEKALIASLDALPAAMARRVIRPAARKAMVPVNKDAKQRAKQRKRTGQLWRSIGIKVKSYTRKGVVWVAVGPRGGFAIDTEQFGKVDPREYAHLVEYGTERTQAHPFLRPAIDSKRGQAQSILISEVKAGIPREVARARRRAAGKGRK